jgi:PPIC-type PPIASE domain
MNNKLSNARWPRWLREPLLHFVVLGALLFSVDHVLASRADDPHSIVVDTAVDAQVRKLFKDARGRDPNAEELGALRQAWLDNEVLYREGMAQQLDKGDAAIRDRVIFKALNVIETGLKLPPFDDALLRDWFEKHRAKYDEPARYDYQEAVLPGKPAHADLDALASALNSGKPGETEASLRIFTGRPDSNLVQSYGASFANALEESPPNQWRVLESQDGPRLVQVKAISAPRPADFESLRGVVLQDWTDVTMAEQRTAVVRSLAKKYKIMESPES